MAAVESRADSSVEKSARFSVLNLLLGSTAVGLGIFVMTQVIGILLAIIAPPLPPLPEAMGQSRHSSFAHGVDEWHYTSRSDPCFVISYYAERGTCSVAPLQCGGANDWRQEYGEREELVAHCSGTGAFSIFEMSWRALIFRTAIPANATRLELVREVYWTANLDDQSD